MSKINIYIDGPTENEMKDLFDKDISGFTFNPTLFKSLSVKDYLGHSQKIQKLSNGLSISLEVIGDSYEEMVFQARKLASLGSNVYVKIPITYTSGKSTIDVIRTLSMEGINFKVFDNLKNTDRIMNNTFWVGVYPGLTEEMLDFVCDHIELFLGVKF